MRSPQKESLAPQADPSPTGELSKGARRSVKPELAKAIKAHGGVRSLQRPKPTAARKLQGSGQPGRLKSKWPPKVSSDLPEGEATSAAPEEAVHASVRGRKGENGGSPVQRASRQSVKSMSEAGMVSKRLRAGSWQRSSSKTTSRKGSASGAPLPGVSEENRPAKEAQETRSKQADASTDAGSVTDTLPAVAMSTKLAGAMPTAAEESPEPASRAQGIDPSGARGLPGGLQQAPSAHTLLDSEHPALDLARRLRAAQADLAAVLHTLYLQLHSAREPASGGAPSSPGLSLSLAQERTVVESASVIARPIVQEGRSSNTGVSAEAEVEDERKRATSALLAVIPLLPTHIKAALSASLPERCPVLRHALASHEVEGAASSTGGGGAGGPPRPEAVSCPVGPSSGNAAVGSRKEPSAGTGAQTQHPHPGAPGLSSGKPRIAARGRAASPLPVSYGGIRASKGRAGSVVFVGGSPEQRARTKVPHRKKQGGAARGSPQPGSQSRSHGKGDLKFHQISTRTMDSGHKAARTAGRQTATSRSRQDIHSRVSPTREQQAWDQHQTASHGQVGDKSCGARSRRGGRGKPRYRDAATTAPHSASLALASSPQHPTQGSPTSMHSRGSQAGQHPRTRSGEGAIPGTNRPLSLKEAEYLDRLLQATQVSLGNLWPSVRTPAATHSSGGEAGQESFQQSPKPSPATAGVGSTGLPGNEALQPSGHEGAESTRSIASTLDSFSTSDSEAGSDIDAEEAAQWLHFGHRESRQTALPVGGDTGATLGTSSPTLATMPPALHEAPTSQLLACEPVEIVEEAAPILHRRAPPVRPLRAPQASPRHDAVQAQLPSSKESSHLGAAATASPQQARSASGAASPRYWRRQRAPAHSSTPQAGGSARGGNGYWRKEGVLGEVAASREAGRMDPTTNWANALRR